MKTRTIVLNTVLTIPSRMSNKEAARLFNMLVEIGFADAVESADLDDDAQKVMGMAIEDSTIQA